MNYMMVIWYFCDSSSFKILPVLKCPAEGSIDCYYSGKENVNISAITMFVGNVLASYTGYA